MNPTCQRCPRLTGFLAQLRGKYPDYHGAPVPAFGDPSRRLLIIGLAPGMHGANHTGRPFTGDYAGLFLYESLYRLGLSSGPRSEHTNDGLSLSGVRITNAVKCLPRANRPTTPEIRQCNDYLAVEIKVLPRSCRLLALGAIAHQAVLRAYGPTLAAYPFSHGSIFRMPDTRTLISSYHCSRYNTQTRRLTPSMFMETLLVALDL